ncbi:TonB-dependent receptor plug domain-containing protein [Haliea sp.]|jgi:iron complex outermembrane receptor protein|uniref:TonB-dependent receptor n=2 Tax=Haliea TaxID=475794 RepID=UPI000C3C8AB5|nr:TonB-dependent receptor plug domain-containing protein [Haliea sp.]MAD63062.1 hypothetical protein [Haliea sp.]MAY91545.1 hypothetical protein [Haliea sp.]MBK40528.1 hypothetical protein [Haliea sp.]MBP68627.1 hypothetical protein [Haliea sp.]|tara:strand:+ start:1005 stop:3446 length:2442 start_codon:yes stop_codon:yes gene_type:complete
MTKNSEKTSQAATIADTIFRQATSWPSNAGTPTVKPMKSIRGRVRDAHGQRGATLAILLAGTSLMGSPVMSHAETTSGDGAAPYRIEEVIVTARRKSETLQDTPVSVTPLSGELIKDLGIQEISGLSKMVPNARFTESSGSGGSSALFIRGQGSSSTSLFQEPSVGVYIDGVFSPRATGNLFSLPDIERVEVLRGPQGTLFGRNTTGGAVLITTTMPQEDAGGIVDFSYGKHNDSSLAFVLHSGEIGSTGIKAKLAYKDRNRDGWVEAPGMAESDWGGSVQERQASFDLLYENDNNLSIRNTVSWSRRENEVPWQILFATPAASEVYASSTNPPPVISLKPQDLQYRDPRRSRGSEFELLSNTLTIEQEINEALTFKSITGYRKLDQNMSTSLGGSYVNVPVLDFDTFTVSVEPLVGHVTPFNPGKQEQFSQEFQLSGDIDEFNYILGLYYWQEEVDERLDVVFGIPGGGPFGPVSVNRFTSREYELDKESTAIFGQLEYQPAMFDSRLSIGAGLRYSRDEVTLKRRSEAASIPAGLFRSNPEQSDDFDNLGFSGFVSYDWGENLMTYVNIGSAFRGGGFNATAINTPSFDEETVLSYEVGAKSTTLDGRVQLNLSGFYMDYEDLQLLSFDPDVGGSFVRNAGEATIAGVEVELIALLTDYIQIDGQYGYVDADMKEFLSGGVDISDQSNFPYIAKNSYRIGAQFTSAATPVGVFTFRTDYAYTGESAGDLIDDGGFGAGFMTGADKNLSARLSLTQIPTGNSELKLKLQIYGDNLTDNRFESFYANFGTTLGTAVASFNRPRNFGISLSAEF